MKVAKFKKGLTLIDVLLAVVAIAILIFIVVLCVNPSEQESEINNNKRSADVNVILNAVNEYQLDTGYLPSSITNLPTEICVTRGLCEGLIDLSVLTDSEVYLTSIPEEPDKTNVNGAGYMISKTDDDQVIIDAQFEECNKEISVTEIYSSAE